MCVCTQARPTMQCFLLVKNNAVLHVWYLRCHHWKQNEINKESSTHTQTHIHRNAQGWIIVGASLRNWLVSFPGSHTPEHKYWSCAGVESLVFFLMWEAVKVERRHLNCVWAYPRFKTGKRGKVAGNLLHVSSYRRSNITHTDHWMRSWLNVQSVAFLF